MIHWYRLLSRLARESFAAAATTLLIASILRLLNVDLTPLYRLMGTTPAAIRLTWIFVWIAFWQILISASFSPKVCHWALDQRRSGHLPFARCGAIISLNRTTPALSTT